METVKKNNSSNENNNIVEAAAKARQAYQVLKEFCGNTQALDSTQWRTKAASNVSQEMENVAPFERADVFTVYKHVTTFLKAQMNLLTLQESNQ